ncbi:isochorismate synthase [Crocosphaera sp. Alani8]|uniref:isochorismate synthase n=1 Tax=Crocosphaera sp. Alani8 TaxID=3038952 RepID=UPI00313BEF46
MSATQPIISNTTNINSYQDYLEQLLISHQETLHGENQSLIVSLSQTITEVDPLCILEFLTSENNKNFSPGEVYFYWQNPVKDEAILGYGVTESCQLNVTNRFSQSKQFIKDCFQKIKRVNQDNFSSSVPYIFCGFTFFSDTSKLDFPFSPAFAFLPRLQIVQKNEQNLLFFNLLINSRTDIKKLVRQTIANIELITKIQVNTNFNKPIQNTLNLTADQGMSHDFKSSVTSVLKSIKSNNFQKLVLANALDLTFSQEFSIVHCLERLRVHHPNCYIFAINNGKNNCFVGASPERLISLKDSKLYTEALAGSTSRGNTKQEDYYLAQNLLKSSKDRREHQVVIEYIVQCLISLGLSPQISPLKILKLANIQHLWTPIYTQLSHDVHPLDVVAKLHPTPAVSGFPTQVACEEIKRYESFERGFYAAPLGWIDQNGNSEFIIGIRSALISKNRARLYAGAGIVQGSEPEKELAEIQLKFQALLKALSDC